MSEWWNVLVERYRESTDLPDDDHALAGVIAAAAGDLLQEVREQASERGVIGRELKLAGDQASHEMIVAMLSKARPKDMVRSEEGHRMDPSDEVRLWIVDPLDGTREFSEPPRKDWAVHVALWDHNKLTAGAVSQPAYDALYTTSPAEDLAPAEDREPIVIVSRSRPPVQAEAVVEAVDGRLMQMGSAGAKAMAVVRGDADIYVHDGGQYEWDTAAPVAVAAAAGYHTSRIDGSPCTYGHENPWSPNVLVCRPELADKVLAAIADA